MQGNQRLGCGTVFRACSNRKIRTCIAAKGLNITFLPQLSCEELTVVQTSINLEEGKTMDLLIGSVYMSYDFCDLSPQDNVKKLIAHVEEAGLELLLGCDANSHHVSWRNSNINPRGENLHDFILDKVLIILNRGTEPTFMDTRRQEVIDIIICTKGVSELIGDWRVLDELSGSDHRQIRLTLRQQPTILRRWNPRKTNWDGFRLDLKNRLTTVATIFHTRDNLETAAAYLSNDISDAFEANCPLKLIRSQTKVPWWNKELSKLRSETRRLFNRARNSCLSSHWKAFKNAQRRYSKEIVSKRSSWREFCEKHRECQKPPS